MATLSLFSSLHSLASPKPTTLFTSVPTSLQWRTVRLPSSAAVLRVAPAKPRGPRRLRSGEESTQATEQEGEAAAAAEPEQQSVSVSVSASDTLTMFFQADGAMSEAAIPSVTQALEEMEGVSNLRVQVVEGIATVELEKLTTVQATGVASSLVESLQGSGFKLQTLQLSFEDQENAVV